MQINQFTNARNWLYASFISVGLSSLKVYSNFYIIIGNKTNDLYYKNNIAKLYIDKVGEILRSIYQFVTRSRMEPLYNPWCSIINLKEGVTREQFNDSIEQLWQESYINLNSNELSIYDKNTFFCLNPIICNNKTITENTYEMESCITGILNAVFDIWDSTDPCLVIFKLKHKYISRINLTKRSENEKKYLEQTAKYILCVEYTHPEMKNPIFLDIDAGYYLEKKVHCSLNSVYRCLKYQKQSYIFDSNYKLKIFDFMMRNVEMNNKEYMVIGKNDYKICKYE